MAVNNYTMRLVVTLESDDPCMDEIYLYCQQHDIVMSCGRYIVVDDHYWIWRIDCEPSSAVTWLLLKYDQYLTSV
jgi:hypothetical protein